MRAGSQMDLLFWCYARGFVCKIYRWGLGPIETCNSGPKGAVLHAQNHRWGLGPIETRNSGVKVAVLHAQSNRWVLEHIETCYSSAEQAVLNGKIHRWGLGPIETCNSGPKVAVLHVKTTGEAWDPERLQILVQSTLFCLHKSTDVVWDP